MAQRIHAEFASRMHQFLEQKRQEYTKDARFKETLWQAAKKDAHESAAIPPSNQSASISLKQAERLADYAPHIQASAKKHGVPVELICGVILQESGGNAKALSPAGAKGLMQLMPATARRMGVKDILDPAQNIEGGTKYLRFLLDKFDGNVELALAGYNAGEGAVVRYGNKIPPFAETQKYVPKVIAYSNEVSSILYGGDINNPNFRRV